MNNQKQKLKETIEALQAVYDDMPDYFEPEPQPQKPPLYPQAVKGSDESLLKYIHQHPDYEPVKCGDAFYTNEAVEREIKKRELRQLAREAMADDWGDDRANWDNANQVKWCIIAEYGAVKRPCFVDDWYCTYFSLHFNTKEAAEAFLNKVGQEGIRMILEL